MKGKEIIDIHSFLDQVKLSRITDKAVRSELMQIYVRLHDAALQVEHNNMTIAAQYFKGMEDRREEKDALIRRLQRAPQEEQDQIKAEIFHEYYDVMIAEDDCLQEIEKSLRIDLDVEVGKVDAIRLVSAFDDSGIEYTGRTLATLQPILDFETLNDLHHGTTEE